MTLMTLGVSKSCCSSSSHLFCDNFARVFKTFLKYNKIPLDMMFVLRWISPLDGFGFDNPLHRVLGWIGLAGSELQLTC